MQQPLFDTDHTVFTGSSLLACDHPRGNKSPTTSQAQPCRHPTVQLQPTIQSATQPRPHTPSLSDSPAVFPHGHPTCGQQMGKALPRTLWLKQQQATATQHTVRRPLLWLLLLPPLEIKLQPHGNCHMTSTFGDLCESSVVYCIIN